MLSHPETMLQRLRAARLNLRMQGNSVLQQVDPPDSQAERKFICDNLPEDLRDERKFFCDNFCDNLPEDLREVFELACEQSDQRRRAQI